MNDQPGSAQPAPGVPPGDLLLVDDDVVLRERLAQALRERGFQVRTAGRYEEAVALAKVVAPRYAIVDLRMPGKGGLELVRALVEIDASTRILVLTGYGSISNAVDAIQLGAVNFVPKPADADDLIAAFEKGRREDPGQATEGYQAPTLARTEWEHIQRVLSDTGGNISEAARRLGIHRRSLQRKLQRFAPE